MTPAQKRFVHPIHGHSGASAEQPGGRRDIRRHALGASPQRWVSAAMKAIVLLLALLVATKVGYQEYLYRAGAKDAIINAYREHAVQACQKDARGMSLGVNPQAWSNPTSIKVVIGKSTLDVYPWQVDHVMWNARYHNPYLFLTTGKRSSPVYCEYDILNAAASVSRM
jgi:hypothetical protein